MEAIERRRYLLWMSFVIGSDHNKYHAILSSCNGDPYEVFKAAQKKDLPYPRGNVDDPAIAALKAKANERYIDKCVARLKELNVKVAAFEDEEYPNLLKHIENPPSVLYYRGILKGDIKLPIALIGSRKPSDYAIRATHKMALDLADQGVTIVSGLAYGLDGEASRGALDSEVCEYPTIAVLGSGVDVVYPRANIPLYNRIIERGCAVVSEFHPGSRPGKTTFVQRNRIISGIAKGVIVAEAGRKSGTFITVDYALEQGRDVFVMPGRIYDPKCEGSNMLIREGGGAIVLSADDVLYEYGKSYAHQAANKPCPSGLDPIQRTIFTLLQNGEKSFDELCDLCGISVQELNSSLTDMELSGIIKQSSGRMYSV